MYDVGMHYLALVGGSLVHNVVLPSEIATSVLHMNACLQSS